MVTLVPGQEVFRADLPGLNKMGIAIDDLGNRGEEPDIGNSRLGEESVDPP